MSKISKRPLNNGSADLGLAAIGSAGGWEIALDESSAEKWFAEIEGPSIYLSFEVQSPDVIQQMLEYLTSGNDADNGTSEIPLGKSKKETVSLVRDDEFHDRFFLIVETQDSLTVRVTISGKDVESLAVALRQANEDIAEND